MNHSGKCCQTVLVVEDDDDVRGLLVEVLEAGGYRAEMAGDGLRAVERLRAGARPDLILLDMTMPVMDGWGFYRELREMPGASHTPVVVFTADGDARRKATELHAQGYLAKPVSIGLLLAEVERICGPPRVVVEDALALCTGFTPQR